MDIDTLKNVMEIQETKTVWVAWTNTDLTEGRGFVVPKAVCELETTAIRVGRRGSVMGSDCHVSEALAVKIKNQWYVPGIIIPAKKADKALQKEADAKREVIAKAKAAGLTDDDIKILVNTKQ